MNQLWKRRATVSLLILSGMTAAPLSARELVAAEINSPGHILVFSEEVMALRLSELTKGELDIQLKHSGQLGSENTYWESVRNGSLDIARVNLGVIGGDVPAAKLLSLPYLFHSRDQLWRVLKGDFGKRINAEVETAGAVVLAYYDGGTRSFYTTKKPIRFRSDFAGLRIAVQDSAVYKDLITLLGGTPVVVGQERIIDAFRNGEIDGAENNTPNYMSSGHYKYARFLSLDQHTSVPEVLVMSKKTWDSLTPEQQKAAKTAAEESSENMKLLWAASEAQALAKAKKEGVVIHERDEISMTGIESFGMKLFPKYVTNFQDMTSLMSVISTK